AVGLRGAVAAHKPGDSRRTDFVADDSLIPRPWAAATVSRESSLPLLPESGEGGRGMRVERSEPRSRYHRMGDAVGLATTPWDCVERWPPASSRPGDPGRGDFVADESLILRPQWAAATVSARGSSA